MTISTEAEVCNLALSCIGVNLRIQSLLENSAEARACKDNYGHARDLALTAFWWSFAEQRASLALSAEERTGWTYVYGAPTGMKVARYIDDGLDARVQRSENRIPFKKVLNATNSGHLILTDQENAVLVYTANVENPTLFSEHFVDCVAWGLAARLALSLKKDPQMGIAMSNQYKMALATAEAHDKNEGQEDMRPDSIFISAR